MGLGKSLLSGIVAFVVTTLVARAVGDERAGTRVGLLAGSSVALVAWLTGREQEVDIEFEDEDEIAAE